MNAERRRVADDFQPCTRIWAMMFPDTFPETSMAASEAQRKALERYRERLVAAGRVRVEFSVTPDDRELLRALVGHLEGPHGDVTRERLRVFVASVGSGSGAGGIVSALLASPLHGAELDLSRERDLDSDRGFEF